MFVSCVVVDLCEVIEDMVVLVGGYFWVCILNDEVNLIWFQLVDFKIDRVVWCEFYCIVQKIDENLLDMFLVVEDFLWDFWVDFD